MHKHLLPTACLFILANTTMLAQDALLAGMRTSTTAAVRTDMALTEAVMEAPADPRTWYARGVDRLAMGDAAGALRDLDRAIALEPADTYALLRRASAHEDLGSALQARKDLHAVLLHHRNGPAAEEALLRLGQFSMREGDHRTALAHFDALVAIAPTDAVAWTERAAANSAGRHFDAALADLEQAIDIDPGMAQAHGQLGRTLLQLDRRQEACHAMYEARDLGDRTVEQLLLLHCDR